MRLYELFQSNLFEDKIPFIAKKQGEKLIQRAEEDTGVQWDVDPEEVLHELAKADPTPNQKYLQWIVNIYLSGQFKLEDVSRINDELQEFERVKSQLPVKDINQYKKLTDLYNALKPFQKQEVTTGNAEEKKLRDEMYSQANVLYKGPDGMLVVPKTQEASCYFGRGTKWCTAAKKDNEFHSYYTPTNPLYIYIMPNR